MSVDVVGLRALAEKAAVEGPWTIWHDLDHQGFKTVGDAKSYRQMLADGHAEDCNPVAHVYTDADAEFIAAANPSVMLALLDEITTLRAEVADRDARIEAALNEARASSVPLGMPEVSFYRAMLRTVEATLSGPAVPVPQSLSDIVPGDVSSTPGSGTFSDPNGYQSFGTPQDNPEPPTDDERVAQLMAYVTPLGYSAALALVNAQTEMLKEQRRWSAAHALRELEPEGTQDNPEATRDTMVERWAKYSHMTTEYALEVGYDDETEGVTFGEAYEDMATPYELMQHVPGARLVRRDWAVADWEPVPADEIEDEPDGSE